MGAELPPGAGAAPTTFSPDGQWWWDGAQWRPAVSPDGRWRWDGRSWVPAQPAQGGSRTGVAILIVVLAFGGVLFLVSLFTVLILYTMGNQIANVFSNVAAALGSTPSP
jgi:Flp pilus assembly pilin Flp